MRTLIVLMLAVSGLAHAAEAHGVDAHAPEPAWTFDPWIVVPLGLSAAACMAGAINLWQRAGGGRPLILLRTSAFAFGWVSLVVALVSPLHWLGERLFTFHMIEHEIIMAISAPMLVAARPLAAFLWSMPAVLRRWAGRAARTRWMQQGWDWPTRGTQATVLHGFVIWVWHVPILFDAAVGNLLLHRLQHVSFFVTAVFFWWSVLWRSDRGAAAWHVFVTMMHTSVLGALMALSPRVLYAAQTSSSQMWGLTPLEDQQLAGVVMWIPAGTIYAGAALVLTALWISQASRGGTDARYARS